MSIFEPVVLKWKEKEYKVAADNVLPLIAKVESIITFNELCVANNEAKPPHGKLSQALGVMLRHAGAPVTDEEVYYSAHMGGQAAAFQSISVLLSMMLPPKVIQDRAAAEASDAGKSQDGNNS